MPNIHALPPQLTIYTVGEFYPQCLSWLGDQDAVDASFHLRADAVQEVDAAGIQLLIALYNELHNHQQSLVLHQPSSRLTTACAKLGVATLTMNAVLSEETP
jgi:hypothetical protein